MIICFDFRSLYPSMMIGGNLYSPADKKDKHCWSGSGVYPSVYENNYDGIRGKYLRTRGKVENVLYEMFQKRLTVKDKPQESLARKIVLNTCYGLLGNPKFQSVCNLTAAADCTAMARRSIHFARTVFEEYGYECVYTDTDSIYVKIKDKQLEECKEVVKWIVSKQISSMNIPFELHDFKIECFIKRMYFFRDDKGEFVKKHYIFIKDDDTIVIKGLKIKQGNCSKIAKLFFEEVISKQMLANKFTLYSSDELLSELKKFSIGKEHLLQKRYRVNSPESYKIPDGKDEANGLHYQIAKKYGKGEHWLIINKRIGAGKVNRYAKLEELKEKYGNDEWIHQVKFDSYLNDLSEFIDYRVRKKIKKIKEPLTGEE